MISFPNVSKQYGKQVLFVEASFQLNPGEKAGLVGPNDALYMVWHAQFHPPDTFTLHTAACALRIGPYRLWLPRWLWR